jgi:hypothetical protein
MDVPFHAGSNDTISSCVRTQRPERSVSSHSGFLVLATQFADMQKEHASVITKFFPSVDDTGQK